MEALWSAFVVVNTAGILLFGDWATVPFHFIWIGLALLYGWRVWGSRATALALGTVVVLTGFAMLDEVVIGRQAPDELTEIPLMAVVFVVMVWYVRRGVDARERYRQVSEHNLALLHRQRQFVQDASHVLRTPLAIALGHAELIRRTAADPTIAGDLDVVIDELRRLKHISDRLLALAATEQPDFLHPLGTRIDHLVIQACSHWAPTHPEVVLGPVEAVSATVDPTHVRDAVDELISNAVRHCPPGTPITLSLCRRDDEVAVRVADEGPGIPADDHPRVMERSTRHGDQGPRDGLGLGLALVTAIAEAHGGRLTLDSAPGRGSVFEVWLPLDTARAVPASDPVGPDTAGRVDGGTAARLSATW